MADAEARDASGARQRPLDCDRAGSCREQLRNQAMADVHTVRRPRGDLRRRVDARASPPLRQSGRGRGPAVSRNPGAKVPQRVFRPLPRPLGEYFGHYRVASAPKFGLNLPGAIHQALSMSGPADCILLDSGIDYLEDEWNLYTLVHGRSDVSPRTTWLRSGTAASAPDTCGGTTAIATAGDARFASWRPFPISEPDGTVVVAVYRRDAS